MTPGIRWASSLSLLALLVFSLLAPLLLALLPPSLAQGSSGFNGSVLVVDLSGAITPASDDIVKAAFEQAQAGNYRAVILILNTPGGGLTETMDILGQMDQSKVPVIGYVYPEGTSAWSAGTLILMGTDVAAMAPHSIIGSAQPAQLSPTGGISPINDNKTLNAMVALIEEKARLHGRNVTAAGYFITRNLNLNASDAKNYGVVEMVSPNPRDLLTRIDGIKAKNITLSTRGAGIDCFELPLGLAFLKTISDPTIAGLLLLIGLYAIIYGLSSPGMGAEIVGVAATAMGVIGLGYDVNIGAFFLILLGLGLVLAELHSHSFGILALAGLICVVAGSILLVPVSYPEWYLPAEYQRSMITTFLIPSLILGAFLIFAVYKAAKARLAPTIKGLDSLIGAAGVALDRLGPRGYVQVRGEYWMAEADQFVEAGQKIMVVGKDGTMLKVKRT
jgi:membrane-bound serine protease (ClpP class)